MVLLWQGDRAVPATRVAAGPCTVVQVKTGDQDGYEAVQLGYGERQEKNIKKPQRGHFKGLANFRYLKEFRYLPEDKKELLTIGRGDKIEVDVFSPGDKIKVTGFSKGKGFQGVVKRHGFHGHNTSHGTKDAVRMPGSIGAGEPQHVFKGMRMGGRMGGEQVTVNNLEVAGIDKENNLLLIKGALPGARNGLILISGKGELRIIKSAKEVKIETPSAAPVAEKPKEEKVAVSEKKEAPAAKETEKSAEPARQTASDVAGGPARHARAVVAGGQADSYAEKFNHLPKAVRDKISQPEVIASINKLEVEYKIDLISVVAKVLIKEVGLADLKKYFVEQFKLEDQPAEEITKRLKEKVFTEEK